MRGGPDIETGLPAWVEVGATFTYKYQPGNPHHGRKFQVRGIVDGQAVIREWWKSKGYWNYRVEPPEYFAAYGDHIVPRKSKTAIKRPRYPSDTILLPSGRGVLCPQCDRQWDPAKGESPDCAECAAAWRKIENGRG